MKLRIGLYLDSLEQPRWIQQIIQDIQASQTAEIVLVVQNTLTDTRTAWQKLGQNRAYLLYAAYSALDARLNPVEPDAESAMDLAPLLAGIPVIRIQPERRKGYLDRFSDSDVETILTYRLDVVLRFGFKILKGRALQTAQYGVWSYHHGDNREKRGQPAAFWEVMQNEPHTGVILQVLTEDLDGGHIIGRVTCGTHPYSPQRNLNNLLWRSVPMMMQALKHLHTSAQASEVDFLRDHAEAPIFPKYDHPLYKRPTNAQMLGLLWKLATRLIGVAATRFLFLYQWYLLYRLTDSPPDGMLYRFKNIIPPASNFWADPFVVWHDGRYLVFFEDYPYRTGKGILAVLEVSADGKAISPPTPILERDYHLSYPFVFQWAGEWYMLPETGDNRTIELYKARRFPDQWELEKALMSDVVAMDTHLLEHDGRWWLFTNMARHGARFDEELDLFYADSPLGPWTPHPLNPVKQGAWSRGAGAIYRDSAGRLMRPTQYTARRSREQLTIHHITRLDTEQYQEEVVGSLQSAWEKDLLAIHTLNSAHRMTIIDARARVFRPLYGWWRRKRLRA